MGTLEVARFVQGSILGLAEAVRVGTRPADVAPVTMVVIDPGHGGREDLPGSSANNAVGPAPRRLLEKEVTLDLARRIEPMLRAAGLEVALTRTDDTNLSAAARAHVAFERNADGFVSLHCNMDADPGRKGSMVLVRPENVELMNTLDASSRRLADALRTEVANANETEDLGVVPAPVAVLAERFHEPRTARCLLEVGFLSNPQDAALLESNAHRDRVAGAVTRAIRTTFESPTSPLSPSLRLGGAGVQYGEGPVPGLPCSFPDRFPEDFTTVAAMHHVEEQYSVDRRTMSSVRWRQIGVQEWSIILQVNGAEHEFRVLWRSTGHLNVHGLTPPLDRWSCNYTFDCDAHDPTFTLVGCIIRNLTFDRR